MNSYFSEKYHNNKNIEIFFGLFQSTDLENKNTLEDFKEQIKFRTQGTIYISYPYSKNYLFEYYINLYIIFLIFNLHYQRKYGLIYNNNINYPINNYYSISTPSINSKNIDYFSILDYEIGKYNQISWNQNYQSVEKTINFLKKHNLEVSDEIKNMIYDSDIINDIAIQYYSVNSSLDYRDLKKFKEFEIFTDKNLVNNDKIKNTQEKYNCINSIVFNTFYHYNILKTLLNNYHNFDEASEKIKNNSLNVKILSSKIEELENKSNENYRVLQENRKNTEKLKDFYLTVTGASIGLISLVVGGIASLNKETSLLNIALFDLSVVLAIFIFSITFYTIYTHDYLKNKKNNRFLILNIVLSIITACLIIFIIRNF